MKSLLHSQSRNLFWKLAAFYATYFFVFGIYMPYWPLWLNDIGLTPIEIGWVLAGAFWIKVIVQPAVAHFSDTTGRTRILTAVLIGVLGLGIVAALAFGGTPLGLDVIGNITSLVSDLASGGVVGLLVLAVLMSLVK